MRPHKMTSPSAAIYVAASEQERLQNLAEASAEPGAVLLREELARAIVIGEEDAPQAFVRLGSTIEYAEPASGRRRTLTLVAPGRANIDEHRISVLSPIGATLLGLVPGASFNWPTGAGAARIGTILSVRTET
jgi:regulator of nucleoside diphosphate kinase